MFLRCKELAAMGEKEGEGNMTDGSVAKAKRPTHSLSRSLRLSDVNPFYSLKRLSQSPWKEVAYNPYPLVSMHWRNSPPQRKGEPHFSTGRAEAFMDAPPETVAAYIWDTCSEERMQHAKKHHDRATFDINNGSLTPILYSGGGVMSMLKRMPWPLSKREFVFKKTWCAEVRGCEERSESQRWRRFQR